MRISLNSLDPASPMAQRIRAAIDRDAAQRTAAPRTPTDTRPETWRREEDLHRAIVGMIAANMLPGVIVFHPANGGKRGKAEAGRLKGMGVVPGIPDLIVIIAGRCHGLEIKTETGRMSAAQKQMSARFQRAGCDFQVARSIAEARTVLMRWGAIALLANEVAA
jgi:hypothetical protein